MFSDEEVYRIMDAMFEDDEELGHLLDELTMCIWDFRSECKTVSRQVTQKQLNEQSEAHQEILYRIESHVKNTYKRRDDG